MRILFALILFSLFPTSAESAGWQDIGSKFSRGCQRTFAMVYIVTDSVRSEALAKIDEIKAKPIADVFPDSFVRRGKTLARVTEDGKRQFGRQFDEYWNARIDGKILPNSEVAEYRRWLRNKFGRPYQPIEAELIYKLTQEQPPVSVGSYFDEYFLDYLSETKRITAENVDDYARTIDPSAVRRWLVRRKKWFGRATEFTMTAMAAALVIQFSSIPADFATSAINSVSTAVFGVTPREYVSGKTKDISTAVVEKMSRDWSLFIGGEEQYNSTLLSLRMRSKDLESRFTEVKKDEKTGVETIDLVPENLNASDAQVLLTEFRAFTEQKLPQFRDLVNSEQKDFDASWTKRLEEFKQPAVAVHASYQQYKIAKDRIEAAAAARTPPETTTEEKRLIADYETEMLGYENYLASTLADWLFYSQARGADRPLDTELNLNYTIIFNSYLRTMSPGKLVLAMNTRVKDHIAQLEKYNKKAAGEKVKEDGEPVMKPEDRTKTENEVKEAAPTYPYLPLEYRR